MWSTVSVFIFNGISSSFTYDQYGRMNQSTEAIQGDQSFVTGYGYDLWNNNTSVTYPSGITVSNTFNTDSYLTEIRNSGALIWKLDDASSLGQPKQYSLGSSGLRTNFDYDTKGFVSKITTGIGEQSFNFDPNTGNLSTRSYKKTNNPATVSESFTYDNMNRLKTYQVSGQSLNTVYYSNNGNITSKPDAGSYTYDGIKLNAVTSVTNPAGIISLTSQNITYTGFNKASLITEGTYETQITYGTDNQRIKSVLKNNGNVIKTTYYIPGYEKEVTTGGTRELHYINSPYGLVAIMIKQGGNTSTYFTETDHLGSIIGLINADGSYAEQFSFDPWGRRRNPTNWTYSSVPQPVLITRGFTGHEHLDNFGLIDMNGRMYDPVLGRFLGVDPIIQAADNSQSIDGYGYCINNPLSYVDLSGYSYYQTMKDLYIGTGYFSYRGGICSYGEDGWSYFQPSLSGGMAPAANLSYDALHQEAYHYDQQGNLRDYNGNILMTSSQVENEMRRIEEEAMLQSDPTKDKGGFVDKAKFFNYMVNHAKNTPVEVGAFELKKEGQNYFFVLPWIDNDRTHTRFYMDLSKYGLTGFSILALFHTHPESHGLNEIDKDWSEYNLKPVWVIKPNGSSDVYIPFLDRKGGEVHTIDLQYFLNR